MGGASGIKNGLRIIVRAGGACAGYEMEQDGVGHPGKMMPDGTKDKRLT